MVSFWRSLGGMEVISTYGAVMPSSFLFLIGSDIVAVGMCWDSGFLGQSRKRG